MKTVSANLLAHLGGEVTTLATLFEIIRTDAVAKRFTSHDEDITYGGFVYESSASYSASAVQTTGDLSVDNVDVEVLIDSAGITESDILAGLYDYAALTVAQINYRTPGDGQIKLRKGRLGEVSVRRAIFSAELRGLAQHLQQTVGRIYQRRCDANLGDARCSVNLAPHTVSGTVLTVTSRERFTASVVPARRGGKLTWLTGANAGYSMEIKGITGSAVRLNIAMPYDVAIGNTFSAYSGCNKKLSVCRDTYNNVANFRGHAVYLPGADKVLSYPNSHA